MTYRVGDIVERLRRLALPAANEEEDALLDGIAEIERLREALQDIDGALKDDTWSDENNWNYIRKVVQAALKQKR